MLLQDLLQETSISELSSSKVKTIDFESWQMVEKEVGFFYKGKIEVS